MFLPRQDLVTDHQDRLPAHHHDTHGRAQVNGPCRYTNHIGPYSNFRARQNVGLLEGRNQASCVAGNTTPLRFNKSANDLFGRRTLERPIPTATPDYQRSRCFQPCRAPRSIQQTHYVQPDIKALPLTRRLLSSPLQTLIRVWRGRSTRIDPFLFDLALHPYLLRFNM